MGIRGIYIQMYFRLMIMETNTMNPGQTETAPNGAVLSGSIFIAT